MDGLGVQVTLGQPDVTADRMVERCLALASAELGCELSPSWRHREERSDGHESEHAQDVHQARGYGRGEPDAPGPDRGLRQHHADGRGVGDGIGIEDAGRVRAVCRSRGPTGR